MELLGYAISLWAIVQASWLLLRKLHYHLNVLDPDLRHIPRTEAEFHSDLRKILRDLQKK